MFQTLTAVVVQLMVVFWVSAPCCD